MRSVALSNTVLVVTSSDSLELLAIRDQVTDIMELTPIAPQLHTLSSMLRGAEYSEVDQDEGIDRDDDTKVLCPTCVSTISNSGPSKITYKEIRSSIQASDSELSHGLRERRIVEFNGSYSAFGFCSPVSMIL
jgi:sister chromatid cohesion protein DCC1